MIFYMNLKKVCSSGFTQLLQKFKNVTLKSILLIKDLCKLIYLTHFIKFLLLFLIKVYFYYFSFIVFVKNVQKKKMLACL